MKKNPDKHKKKLDHTNNVVEIRDLSFRYNKEQVLESINLQIHKGDYLAIVGPNGGGKSTLLKCILGILKPQKGTVKIFGEDLKQFKSWPLIGYVPQNIEFERNFPATAREVVGMGLYGKKGLFRRLDRTDEEAVDDALDKVGMKKFSERRISDLSGGQEQRIFIARALVSNPEIIFLDEPTVGIDTETRNQFFTLLEKLNNDFNLTLVLITHDMDIIMHHGVIETAVINKKILFYGTPSDLTKTKHIDEHYRISHR
jgi:zinc transport system ATP-binding protein